MMVQMLRALDIPADLRYHRGCAPAAEGAGRFDTGPQWCALNAGQSGRKGTLFGQGGVVGIRPFCHRGIVNPGHGMSDQLEDECAERGPNSRLAVGDGGLFGA